MHNISTLNESGNVSIRVTALCHFGFFLETVDIFHFIFRISCRKGMPSKLIDTL